MSSNTLNASSGFAGWFKIEAFRTDEDGQEIPGSRRIAADWFPNLITNAGLDLLGTTDSTDVFTFCRVGSGNTAPAVTDTALVSQVAVTSSEQAITNGVDRSGAFYAWRRRTLRFANGAAAGTLAEVGVSPTNAGALFSRALILDSGGSPTTITVLSDETLDVTYELRLYPVLTDATGTVDISGTTYNWTARPLIPASYDVFWSTYLGRGIIPYSVAGNPANGPAVAAALPTQGSALSSPVASGIITALAYTNGSYQRSFRFDCDLNNANVAGGIGCFFATAGTTNLEAKTFGAWAWGLSPKLPKTASFKATFTIRMSWGRYTP
ncbi:hypothetical protein [Stenotrophomonas maltophilia]|uniref:hypothetical protein n=1 Tax=Stenotrophomonas maltophilia TaxID=40324 RepID=UPI000DA911E1|nr:hypothetical protein [Stenotrophomonas maltophilia]MBH1878193.1 hypothetical protein [Stenotrophomonas maltophilia]PZS72864.1 hypothetical protein A7X75_00890 [Stenotrophomonas maltophilia]